MLTKIENIARGILITIILCIPLVVMVLFIAKIHHDQVIFNQKMFYLTHPGIEYM